MLLRIFNSAGFKYLPRMVFQRSSRECNKFFVFLTAPLHLRICRNLSISVETDIFNEVHFQKYLNYIENRFSSSGQSQETEKLRTLLEKKRELEQELKNLECLSSEDDKELQKLVDSEKKQYQDSIETMKSEILYHILPEDDNDNRNIELKVIPGIGGEEAKLFSEELYNMYKNYAILKNWEWVGDHKNGFVLINGEHVFGHLRQESGVHRVQRVPVTETSGRTQSSTCSVVILPQPRPNEIQIHEKDVTVEKMKSSGPGGQNVNKRETCIRIKHIPSGIVIENQTSRFQHQNLKEAINRLRIILFNQEQEKVLSEKRVSQKKQIGTNDYSDKVRTYNFTQNRVTDHRINYTAYNLRTFLAGGKELDHVINQVRMLNLKKELLLNARNILESVEYKKFEEQEVR